ncbi:MAG: ABC transporter ATP-binding protein [Lachnospiraceae bacterium]
MKDYIKVKEVNKFYPVGESKVHVLNDVDIDIEQGKICTIFGPSGSGKSTLLNVIGGLDSVDSGQIIIDNKEITNLKQKDLVNYRKDYLGFIFQFYNLLPELTVRENIQVCENLSDNPLDIEELIIDLGLKEHENKFPSQLSGGQQQRCSIARALVKNPRLLLCDEPTGALDYQTSKEILIILEQINKKRGTTMLIVTHNLAIKGMSHIAIKIKDGRVDSIKVNEEITSAERLEW